MATKVLTLKEERTALDVQARELIDLVDSEDRDFTQEEETQFNDLERKIEELNKKIELEERKAKFKARQSQPVEKPEVKVRKRYSLAKAISEFANGGRLTGVEAEMDQEARRNNPGITHIGIPSLIVGERTTLTAGTDATAGYLVETELDNQLIKSLQPNPVIFRAGATLRSGLVGDVDLPRETTAATASWEGETDPAAETNPIYDKLTLSPNRVGAFTTISKQLLAQNRFIADAEIAELIRQATARALDSQAINGSGSPITGILNLAGIGSVVGGANGAVPAWDDIVNLEGEIFTDNAEVDGMVYLTTPGIRSVLKYTAKDAGSGMMLMNGNEANGYPVLTSTLVPSTLDKGTNTGVCHAIIFGNFRDMVVGQWSNGYDVVVDPYSGAKNATIDVVVNSWWDIVFRHPESFAAMKDALLA